MMSFYRFSNFKLTHSQINLFETRIQHTFTLQVQCFNPFYIKEFPIIQTTNMQKEQIKVELAFKQYPSIEISTRDKFLLKIKEQGHDKPDVLWVASQKIHGSNFSVHYDGRNKIARYGRRTDFLSKQIPVPCEKPGDYFTESFLDARNLVTRIHNHLDHVFNKIKETYPEVEIIQIYGEYFGGLWPANHAQYVKGPSAVQKGVYYTPNHEFMAFDIKVTSPNAIFWIDAIDIEKFLDSKIMHVPIFAKGNFEELIQIETVFDSTIPELLGLQRIEKNIIEGLVLRPNKSVSNSFGERVILKKKNNQFLEKASAPKVSVKKQNNAVDLQLLPYIEGLTPYLNINRIESAISKFPETKDRNKIKTEVARDIYSDAQKDEFKWAEHEEINRKAKGEFEKLIMKDINAYYIKH